MAESDNPAGKVIDAARDALTVRRVFGEAYEADGATVIPVARVLGGAGMGYGSGMGRDPRAESDGPNAEGTGGGGTFGACAQPAGVFVIRGGEVTWKPALDLNVAILGGQLLGGVIAIAVACTARVRAKSQAQSARWRRG
ncbi:spore germination protein GerW family protein [Ruania zhangjianzhongii]|uniref:spore germination protein GerW family protein n=1 Tax=Ruania zhangjianzhongii TaxID=2603206 RepID=UPI0011CAF7B0|nr:spore germination protein GerW family protein [Ruania zhangjianzhongii]